ncbi:MAG TPA: OmpA family protein [Candidatus Aquilonibacter sp.]|nr:OmpA family protein [Candidatus Aquilonibacter sp.]
MADDPVMRLPLDPDEETPADAGQSFEKLRHLILAPEQEDLARLRERVENPDHRASDLSAVLPEAIRLRRRQGGEDALGDALAPTVEAALRESVRKDPATLADALFPVMGPAIRRSILQTLRQMFESFNETMEQSLSLRGLQWRFQALRTGRPFSEVVLLHSLVFRAEQVFLIHKKTGLPLCHVVAPAVAMQDPSLVSGMLSAIQDFVRDSFQSERGQGIAKMQVGELEVWVEEGPYAVVAAVIRGMAPAAYRSILVEAVERVHRKFGPALERFQGETSPFEAASEDLTRSLETRYREKQSLRPRPYVLVFSSIALALFAGLLAYAAWRNSRWQDYVQTLRQQPGVVVTSAARHGGHFVIGGLRDPLSPDPVALLRAAQLDPRDAEFHWGSYYALDDSILQQRVLGMLKPPSGVQLTVADGTLHAQGVGSDDWVASFPSRAVMVPGIREVDASGLIGATEADFRRVQSAIQSAVLMFPVGSAEPAPAEADSLKLLAPEITSFLRDAQVLHHAVSIDVVGHSDSTGAESTNEPLSRNRAQIAARQLERLGVPRASLEPVGVASSEPLRPETDEGNRQYNRSVTFRISTPAPSNP